MAPDTTDVFTAIDRRRAEFLDELDQYLRIPSVSTDPAYRNDINRCADFVRDRFQAAGLTARLVESGGHPLVYAEWLGAPGKPTLLFYGHYDVQPPDPLELWRHPPFEPTLEGGDLVARGATDDKGQSHAHMAGVAAMLAVRGSLPVNVKFIIEGEEESGGQAIESYVRSDAGKKQLACDAVVVSDSAMLAPGQPSLLYSLRGIAYFELAAVGPNIDLHSGTFGGVVQNPLHALSIVLAGLKDPVTGRILIDGFYDDVRALEPWEREEMKAIAIDDTQMARELGVPELQGERGFATRERIGGRPTYDVHGMWGGYQAAGAKTVLPSRAGAKISMRLVPDQDPDRVRGLVERHVERATPRGVRIETKFLHGAKPLLIDAKGPMIEAAIDAMEDVWGRRPVRVREGGSIPIVSTFVDELRAPVLLIGFGLPDDRLHAPNEKLDLAQYMGGIRSTARLLDRVGSL
jgi:acetylornithine deacetylase/succinyl-diaminopimelate desuccinylase-like protein